jgi:hypothetical protein
MREVLLDQSHLFEEVGGTRFCSSPHSISRLVAFLALVAILIATLNLNVGANVVSPSNDFSSLYPRLDQFPHRPDHRLSGPGDVPLEIARNP